MTTTHTQRKSIGRLHVIVDTVPMAKAALDGGASVLQVRVKSGSDRRRFEITDRIADHCARVGALCIVNDRLDLALAADAGGVHLGADDLPVAAARRVCPDDFVIGASTLGTTAAEVIDVVARVAKYVDYVGVGPVYPTTSKPDVPPPMGEEELAKVVRRCDVPVIAISGITVDRVPVLRSMGVWGIAVMAAVTHAPDPAQAVVRLREALDSVEQHTSGSPERRTSA